MFAETGQSSFDHIEQLAGIASPVLVEALRTGGDYADLFVERTAGNRIRMSQRQRSRRIGVPVVNNREWANEGAGIHVFSDQASGFSSSVGVNRQSLMEAAGRAAAQIDKAVHRNKKGSVVPTSFRLDHETVGVWEDEKPCISETEINGLIQTAADFAWSIDDQVSRVEVECEGVTRRILVVTSDGELRSAVTNLTNLRVFVTMVVDQKEFTSFAVGGGTGTRDFLTRISPENIVRKAVSRAKIKTRSLQRIDLAGSYPVIIAAGWGGVWMHEAIGHMLEADAINQGISPYAGRLGDLVADSSVTLVDDPSLAGARGSLVFDDEGTPAQRTVLVDRGWLSGYLTDRRYAGILQLSTTGNGRRQDYRHAPLPRMTNLVLQPGKENPDDLIEDVRRGLYVKSIGSGMVEPDQMRYSFEVLEGYLIEEGKCTVPLTGNTVSGNVVDTMSRITGIGDDLYVEGGFGICKKNGQAVPVSIGMPTVYFTGLDVS